MTADKLLFVHTVANMLSCSRQYVHLLIDNGHLEAVKCGYYLRVKESSVRAWLEKHKYNPEDKYALKEQ